MVAGGGRSEEDLQTAARTAFKMEAGRIHDATLHGARLV